MANAVPQCLTILLLLTGMENFVFSIHLEPFANSADRFEYVMTTAYYLCWFSMLELPVLAHLPYCELTDKWHMTFNSDRDRNKR